MKRIIYEDQSDSEKWASKFAEPFLSKPLIITKRQVAVAFDCDWGDWRFLVYSTCIDFLKMTTGFDIKLIDKICSEAKTVEQYNAWSLSGKINVAPFLIMNVNKAKRSKDLVFNHKRHEGRHRACALKKEGKEHIAYFLEITSDSNVCFEEKDFPLIFSMMDKKGTKHKLEINFLFKLERS